MSAAPVVSASPRWMTPALAVVPPMSKATASPMPSARQSACADHPCGRTRLEHAHALRPRLSRLVEPARRLDEQEGPAEPGMREVIVDAAEIPAHHRADVGIGDGSRAALELAVFLRKLV